MDLARALRFGCFWALNRPTHDDASIVASIVSASQAVQRFAAKSTIGDLIQDPMMIIDRLDPGHFPATVDLMAEERATLVTILLQRHRMIHGEFPDSLVELAYGDEIISMQLTDPWSGTPFFYAPKGLPTPMRLGFENEQYRIALRSRQCGSFPAETCFLSSSMQSSKSCCIMSGPQRERLS
jgi:hypothetical protein